MSKTGSTSAKPSPTSGRLKYVVEVKGRAGAAYLYYRRDGRRIPLPQPEGSGIFLDAYHAAEQQFRRASALIGKTIQDAIGSYYASADFQQLAPASQSDYRRTLDQFMTKFGAWAVASFGDAEIESLRTAYVASPVAWNSLRSRMIAVVKYFRRIRPGELIINPWQGCSRLKVEQSNAHRPWPPKVLLTVMQAATPEYRALLVGYLMTAQRGGDVTTFRPSQYDTEQQTLAVAQGKTEELILLHVPVSLGRALQAMSGNEVDRLFVTPRGKEWDLKNAQETLRTLLRNLGLPRYTLHGLRATGPTALKLLGFENRAIRALTGHTSDKNLELYLRGVDHYPLARQAQEALEGQFAELLAEAEGDGNQRKFSGVTGRAARAVKPVQNCTTDSEDL